MNVKTVGRAATHAEVLGVCLAHNLRQGNEEHRHRSRIDPSKTALNDVLVGHACPVAAADLASGILDELGIKPPRCDSIMGIELVFQPPTGADLAAFWSACLAWSEGRYQHIVSAVVHLDQARPHMHLLALAVADGRLDGTHLTAGSNRFTLQRRDFLAHMRNVMGLRPDRKVKTLADLAVSTGKGAKTRTAAARRDAELTRKTGTDWKRADVGMVVDGHGGSASEMGNHHAQAKTPTTLLRSFSRLSALSWKWAQVAEFQRQPSAPMPPCPKPSQGLATPAQAPATATTAPTAERATKATAAPTHPAAPADETVIRRERESDHAAERWCEELGEFVAGPATPSRGARMQAVGWVAAELARISGRGVHGP